MLSVRLVNLLTLSSLDITLYLIQVVRVIVDLGHEQLGVRS